MLTWALLALFLGLLYWVSRKPSGLPPGRWGLPVIGYIPLYTTNIGQIISDLTKEYGDIFTWKVGSQVLVGLCDYKLIKSTFSRPECQGRPSLFTFELAQFHMNTGIINAVDDVWTQGRRFALRHLKDFGMGKSSLESVIQYEAAHLARSFEATSGKPVEISWNLNVAALNVLWKLVANRRYEMDDKEVSKFSEAMSSDIQVSQTRCLPLDLFPGLHKILPKFILHKWMKVDVLYENMEKLKEFAMEIIKEHEENFDPDNLQDYIDVYLSETRKERGGKGTIFQEDYANLATTICDLFVAGSETTSSTMRWMVALLATHPEVQKKMQGEIDSVVSRDQPPSIQDREKLPYTDAVLLEVMRFSSLLPIGLLHATTEDVQIGEYRLPKGTGLFASARTCHRDPKYFERPEEFYPEHFLDEEGKVISKKEGFLPFSLGRRQCLGENLARMELFLFATSLVQKFSASPPEGTTISPISDPSTPLLCPIKPYEVVLTLRD
ncbi:cytochrome P450 2L1-like [Macrobrachium rosenbergii]|uniref:cytochrome P450 2L1-like n=1 Tax=Macrobrachium rosenbergii TaxID=79674 RepID=UPI0034D78769